MNISTPAGPGGLTLGQMADQVSRALIGVPASDSIDNPSKTQIIEELNNAQNAICSRHQDWTFLDRLIEVNGYEQDTTVTSDTVGATNLHGTDYAVGGTAATNTDYVGTTVTYTRPSAISNVYIQLSTTSTGFAGASANIRMLFCNIVNGVPDVANPIVESDAWTIDNGVISSGGLLSGDDPAEKVEVPFHFNPDEPVIAGTYAIVLRMIFNNEAGHKSLKVWKEAGSAGLYSNTTFAGSTWTLDSTVSLAIRHDYYGSDYLEEIQIPYSMSKIYQVYDVDSAGEAVNVLTEDRDTKNEFDPIYGNTFRVVGSDEGITYVQIPPDLNVLNWRVEGMIYANIMTNDSDTAEVPVTYRRLLVYDAIITLRSLGYGLTSPENLAILGNKLAQGMSDMEMHLRRLPPNGISAPRETSTSTLQGATRRFDRSQSGRPRFANQRRY